MMAMSMQRYMIHGAMVLFCLLNVGLAQSSDGPQAPKAAKPNEGIFTGKAIYVVYKGGPFGGALRLEQVRLKQVGNLYFLSGRTIEEAPMTVWVPLSGVAMIAEFADAKALNKVYGEPSALLK
jgi:hypothetical protein